MILHNIGHAILDDSAYKTKVFGILNKIIAPNTLFIRSGRGSAESDKAFISKLAPHFKFSSARKAVEDPSHKSAVNSVDEFIFELMAEYLWNGMVRSENPELTNQIGEVFDLALHEHVGKIIVDWS